MPQCRGQVLRVEAPWVKHLYFGGSQYYVLPNVDTVVLGGTTQKNNWDTNASEEVRLQYTPDIASIVLSGQIAVSHDTRTVLRGQQTLYCMRTCLGNPMWYFLLSVNTVQNIDTQFVSFKSHLSHRLFQTCGNQLA